MRRQANRPAPRMRGWLALLVVHVSLATGGRWSLWPPHGVRPRRLWATSGSTVARVLGLFGVSALSTRHVGEPAYPGMDEAPLTTRMIFLFIAGTSPRSPCWRWITRPVHRAGRGVGWRGGRRCLKCVGHTRRVGSGCRSTSFGLRGCVCAAAVCCTLPVWPCCAAAGRWPAVHDRAIFYATRWPNPWPTTFGHHEFFHAATVLAALCATTLRSGSRSTRSTRPAVGRSPTAGSPLVSPDQDLRDASRLQWTLRCATRSAKHRRVRRPGEQPGQSFRTGPATPVDQGVQNQALRLA